MSKRTFDKEMFKRSVLYNVKAVNVFAVGSHIEVKAVIFVGVVVNAGSIDSVIVCRVLVTVLLYGICCLLKHEIIFDNNYAEVCLCSVVVGCAQAQCVVGGGVTSFSFILIVYCSGCEITELLVAVFIGRCYLFQRNRKLNVVALRGICYTIVVNKIG